MELSWLRGSTMGGSKAEYQSLVQYRRKLERTFTRNCSDVKKIPSFWSQIAGFRARRHLYRVGSFYFAFQINILNL